MAPVIVFGLGLLLLVLGWAPAGAQPPGSTVVLSTTTSTQDSGLLDVLVPLFERQSGLTLKPVSVGTGQALALAARGEADVVLVHAPALEKKYLAEGKLLNRRLVMYNDFVVVGPTSDPAKIRGEPRAAAALAKIAAAGARFVSRGDKSGTHLLEQALWKETGVTPAAPWYIESGQGMGATLGIADDRRAYTLTDRATYLALSRRLALATLAVGIPAGAALALLRFPGRTLVVSVVNAGMGLPPVVVGLFVTLLLWRSGPLGAWEILYTPAALVLAQAVIAAPIVMGITLAAVQNVPEKFRLQLLGLGASPLQTVRVVLREARLPMLAAVMAGFGGIISEIGASMMVGGNIKGQTRTLTTAMVLETGQGNFEIAIALSILLLVPVFVLNWVLTSIQQRRVW